MMLIVNYVQRNRLWINWQEVEILPGEENCCSSFLGARHRRSTIFKENGLESCWTIIPGFWWVLLRMCVWVSHSVEVWLSHSSVHFSPPRQLWQLSSHTSYLDEDVNGRGKWFVTTGLGSIDSWVTMGQSKWHMSFGIKLGHRNWMALHPLCMIMLLFMNSYYHHGAVWRMNCDGSNAPLEKLWSGLGILVGPVACWIRLPFYSTACLEHRDVMAVEGSPFFESEWVLWVWAFAGGFKLFLASQ